MIVVCQFSHDVSPSLQQQEQQYGPIGECIADRFQIRSSILFMVIGIYCHRSIAHQIHHRSSSIRR